MDDESNLVVSPGTSPLHQDSSLAPHSLAGGLHHNLVNPKTKTALANLLSNRLSGPQQIELPVNVAPGEQVVVYRRTLSNITGGSNVAGPGTTIVRPGGVPHHIAGTGYPRAAGPHSPGQVAPALVGGGQHFPRPTLFGHDTNTMLPRDICLLGCIFYIADYHAEQKPETIDTWCRVIQTHGGEVVHVYDSLRVSHILCKNQKSPVYLQAVKEGKRCITIFWLNDILLRGKMAPPWQAIHLPTPYDNDNQPCRDLLISVTGFETEEKNIVKLMIQLVGGKYTGCFSKHNHILISKKFEGNSDLKLLRAREFRTPIVNGIWLSEVLQGQNVRPLICHGAKYQHQLDDPLRIDPSLASHLFNAWKTPINVSKEAVEKAKANRETALRKRKAEIEEKEQQENKKPCIDGCLTMPIPEKSSVVPDDYKPEETDAMETEESVTSDAKTDTTKKKPRIAFSSNVKNLPDLERKIQELGGSVVDSPEEATHLVMGGDGVKAERTIKMMCAVSCCDYIVSVAWLLHSHHFKTFIKEDKYMLKMPEFERLFQFSLEESMKKTNRRQLFSGTVFHLTPTVIPGRSFLKRIIESAGGVVEEKRRSLAFMKQQMLENSHKYIIICIEHDEYFVKDLLEENIPIFTAEFILGSILRQEITLELCRYGKAESQ